MTIRQGIDDLAALEDAFGIPSGYIDALKNEDDWTVIIKSHALIESATANMLCHYFGKPELADVFARLDMSSKSFGKTAFISALKLLGKKERRFLSELSELRNLVVHNAANVQFRLVEYVGGLSDKKRSEIAKGLNIRLKNIEFGGRTYTGEDLVVNFPVLVLWSSLTHCLSQIYIRNVFAINTNSQISTYMASKNGKGPQKIDHAGISLKL